MAFIATIALAFQQPPVSVDRPDPAQEVVVIGERLKTWRASVHQKRGEWHCKIERSTGDAEIDAIGCTAMTTCFPQFQSRFIAAANKELDADVRRQMNAATSQGLTACVVGKRDELSAELAEKRRARQGD